MATSSFLLGESQGQEEPSGLQSSAFAKVQTQLKQLSTALLRSLTSVISRKCGVYVSPPLGCSPLEFA